jgi:hypothetical protein
MPPLVDTGDDEEETQNELDDTISVVSSISKTSSVNETDTEDEYDPSYDPYANYTPPYNPNDPYDPEVCKHQECEYCGSVDIQPDKCRFEEPNMYFCCYGCFSNWCHEYD